MRYAVVSGPPPVIINLGIDFGTTYTKVCFRDIARYETGFVRFNVSSGSDTLIQSVVSLLSDGSLVTPAFWRIPPGAGTKIEYLKMRLVGDTTFGALPTYAGLDLNDPIVIRSLCSWFLAVVIEQAKSAVLRQIRDRAARREIRWSANVGVPIEYYDSVHLADFEEALKVAWAWAEDRRIPRTLTEAVTAYHPCAASDFTADCHALPEIVAAVYSFVTSGQADEDAYLYFDIGGGTLDGVGFHFKQGAAPPVECYSASVRAIGAEAIALRAGSQLEEVRRLLSDSTALVTNVTLREAESEINKLVAHILMEAKKKDRNNWLRRKGDRYGKTYHPDDGVRGEAMKLPVFLGGGAACSAWYRHVITSTHGRHHLANSFIPEYDLRRIPEPSDLIRDGKERPDFSRFAIAYGLASNDPPRFSLPRDHDYAPPKPKIKVHDAAWN